MLKHNVHIVVLAVTDTKILLISFALLTYFVLTIADVVKVKIDFRNYLLVIELVRSSINVDVARF